jgi:hypothetical protein
VRGRIAQRRRNRLAAAAAAGAVLLAGVGGYAVGPWPPVPRPSGGRNPLAAVPDHFEGHLIVGRVAAPLRQRVAGFTWTPSTLDIRLYLDCAHDTPGVTVTVEVSIDGRTQFQRTCGETAALPVTGVEPGQAGLAGQGIMVGRPSTVTLTVLEVPAVPSVPSGSGTTPAARPGGGPPVDGYMSLLLGERVG